MTEALRDVLYFIYGFSLALLGPWFYLVGAVVALILVFAVLTFCRGIYMKLLIAVLIVMALPGCAGVLMSNAIHQGQDLSPEQIKAYNESGSAVYGCFQIGGPPPVGNTQWLILPKTAPVTFKFGDNCHVIQ